MMNTLPPYELSSDEKKDYVLDKMNALTKHHRQHCRLYSRYLSAMNTTEDTFDKISDLPFLPARAFKGVKLVSSPSENISSTALSSGTSGLQSKIYLDARTKLKQSLVLKEILSSFMGKKKLPLLVIDAPSLGHASPNFNARKAGVLGFVGMASMVSYALNEELELQYDVVSSFLEKHGQEPFIVFGFTYLIWQKLITILKVSSQKFSMDNAILFHGGGWKKLQNLNISNDEFKADLKRLTNLTKVHNYYGMVEQTGSLFVECEHGHLHASKYSEVLIRDEGSRELLPPGQKGVIQVLSSIPESYPGHSVLTEDVGYIREDQLCKCGRNGTTVVIEGRLKAAEIRGCSDVY